MTVIINDSGYADIHSAIKLPKSIICPEQIIPTQIILEEDWENEWNNIPEFIQKKIAQSHEYIDAHSVQDDDLITDTITKKHHTYDGAIRIEDIPL